MILHYITTAFRSLKKNKFYSALSIGGFAVGFSICIIIGLYAYQELTVDRGFEDSERIYRIIEAKQNNTSLYSSFTASLYGLLPEIESVTSYSFGRPYQGQLFKTEYAEVLDEMPYIYTSEHFFELFSIEVLAQQEEKLFLNKESIVLSESFSKQLFGSKNPLGQKIDVEMNGRSLSPYIVSAVVADMPANTSMSSQYYLDQRSHYRSVMTYGGEVEEIYYFMGSLVKLYDGANLSEFTQKLNAVEHPHMEGDSLSLQALSDVYLGSNGMKDPGANNDKSNVKLIYVLLSIAVLILILSVLNFINYSTVRFLGKQKIIAIRKANGAGLSHILKYDLAEAIVSLMLSIGLSIVFVFLLLPCTQSLLGKEVDVALLFTLQPFCVLIMSVLFILVLITIVPFWGIFKLNRVKHIKEDISNRKGGRTNLLSIFQFVIAIVLLVAVFAINKQLYFVRNVNLGFEKEHIVYTYLSDCQGQGAAVKAEFEKLPFVIQASLSGSSPHRIGATSSQSYTTTDGQKKKFRVYNLRMDENYLGMYNIGLQEGVSFLINSKGHECLVNQALLDELEIDTAVGADLREYIGNYKVIGVVNDFHFASYHNKIEPLLIRYMSAKEAYFLSLKLESGDFLAQKQQMQDLWKEFVPDYPLELHFIDNEIEAMYVKEERLSKAISGLSFLAFLLVTLGILGQVFQITLNKTKEIGMRKVNGASLFDVFRIINARFVIWVTIGFILAVPISYYALQKWLENFAYKTPLSWWVFALAGLGALVFVVGVVTLQAWKTARRNPVEALRYE